MVSCFVKGYNVFGVEAIVSNRKGSWVVMESEKIIPSEFFQRF